MAAPYARAFSASLALHAAITGWLVWPARIAPPGARTDRSPEVVLLPPTESQRFPGLEPLDGAIATETFDHGATIAGADLERIGSHVAVLFPFVTPGLALDRFFPAGPTSPSRLVFQTPFARTAPSVATPTGQTLRLNAAAIQALVDQTWTRANRWKAFDAIEAVIARGAATDVPLARLVAMYRDQNALQPYTDGSVRDLRLWAQLGLAADHVSFIGYIRTYAAAHPSTRVTTELLLLLDTIAQANEDALAVLVETSQPDDLEWTRRASPRAYELARRIQAHYGAELARMGLTTRADVEAFYGRGRLALLTRTLATTPQGYRADELRFLIGAIEWRQREPALAIRVWRGMTGSPGDVNAAAIEALRSAVAVPSPSARNIDAILKNQQGRWLSFSQDRLARFGYRFDTY